LAAFFPTHPPQSRAAQSPRRLFLTQIYIVLYIQTYYSVEPLRILKHTIETEKKNSKTEEVEKMSELKPKL
jgi:hypothetical protein